MIMDRLGVAVLSVVMASAACTVSGKEIESSFFDPTANPSGTPPTTSDGDETESTEGSEDSETPADTGSTSTAATTAATDEDSTGAPPVDEQPDDGMYSACMGVAMCIGLTTCVLAGPGGFCSNTGCTDPLSQCAMNPGATSTATPACVDNGTGQIVCALSCAGGLTCPGGMECVALGASMVCV